MAPIVNHREDIVRDSIIKNKEKTKCYWEQLMMQAAESNQARPRSWDNSLDQTDSSNHSNRNSVSSIEYTEDMTKEYEEGGGEAEIELEMTNVRDERRRIERQLAMDNDRERYDVITMEDKIAMELQEMREREEELRQLRKIISGSVKSKTDELTLNSLHTVDDGNCSEYGSEDKDSNSRVISPDHSAFSTNRRTQSMDSMSSGHSSGSGGSHGDSGKETSMELPRRRNIVRPYEDPEDEVAEEGETKRIVKETPIEREIRLAKEREDELRRETFRTPVNKNETDVQKAAKPKINKKDAVENDPRDIQHKLATNRIQREIEEVTEKEDALRKEGKIVTPSEETVDNKVTRFTQLVQHSILENRYRRTGYTKMKRSSSTSQLLQAVSQEEKPPQRQTHSRTFQPATRSYTANPTQKGIMERFIASKGRLSQNNMEGVSAVDNSPPVRYHSLDYQDMPSRRPLGEARKKTHTSAEEKIQEELKEMRSREEELKVQRARTMGRSQPNLLDVGSSEEITKGEMETPPQPQQQTERAKSNVSNFDSYKRVNSHRPKKLFSLLEEWENKIQSIQQES